jgi:hypothetical protein
MLKLSPENKILDIPDLNRFRIGDEVIADECADHDRHEGIIVGIELQRSHASGYLVPSITLLHDGYLTDGFRPADLRHVTTAAAKPFTFADPSAQLQHERHRAESNRRDG